MKFSRVWRVILCALILSVCARAASSTNDFRLGDVRIDPSRLAISFPAQVNQRTGLVEYLLVHETGKVHESIFKTSIGAQQIHAAALLFAQKSTNGAPKPVLESIEISWTDDKGPRKFRAADLVLDRKKKRALGETKWAYRGSRLVEGIFLAQRDGSIIAIMEDRDALVEQDTPDASDDENWEPVTERIPKLGADVVVSMKFDKPRK